MSENQNDNNIICSHTNLFKEYNINKISYSYCEQCGNISIKHDNHFYYTIIPKYKQKKIDINPVIATLNMKKNQDISYPNLSNIFNLNVNDSFENIRELKNKITIYLQKRGLILVYLKNITKNLNYSDLSFYHCLFLVDLYLSHNITEEMTDEDLLYLLVGFFLVASKFKESDIFEPKFEKFNQIESNITLSKEKIFLYEKQCLKYINYNFFNYSTFEWINTFMSNGYIFEGEIEEDENLAKRLKEIYDRTYTLLVTVTPRNIFIKFSPIYMAMALIEISREEMIDKNRINLDCFKRLLDLYDIEYNDYALCYKQAKALLTNKNNVTKIKSLKIGANAIQTPQKKKENTKLEQVEYHKGYKSCEKSGNNNRTINRTQKALLDINKDSRLKIKQKLKNSKIKLQLCSTAGPMKGNKRFHSIIVNNNFTNSKIYNFNKNRKNIEIVEFIGSLPNIYNMETNKTFKTEGQTITGRNFKVAKPKNEILSNFTIQNKILKNREGSSADNKSPKINTINEISETSPLQYNILLRNGTTDSFEENKKLSKLFYKNNLKNHKENNSIVINNNSDSSGHQNIINIENNKFNNNNNKNVNYIINSYLGNSNKLNKKNNNNIYKNYSNVYNNNLKSLFRQSASDYISNNDIITLREEKPFMVNNTRDISIINNKMKSNSKMKDSLENINISVEKEISNLIDKNKKSFLSNIKPEKSNINTFNDLLSAKKMAFKNPLLPKIKLKLKLKK